MSGTNFINPKYYVATYGCPLVPLLHEIHRVVAGI